MNQVFAAECVVRSASGFRCRRSATNQVFAVQLCCSQRIRFSLLNSLTASLQVFAAYCVVAVNYVFTAKLCCPQRIRCSLPQLCYSQQIRFLLLNSINRSDWGFCFKILLTTAIQVFTNQICVVRGEIVLFIVNQVFAAECVVRSESGFRCRICVVRIESGVCCPIVLFTGNHIFVVEFFDRSASGFRYPLCGRSE